MKKPKIIIDTDPGHDDALAIMLMEKSQLFDILAITTVAGNSIIQNTTNNARYILDLIGSTTPLYSGASTPLKRGLIQAVVHGKTGLAGAEVAKEERLTGNASSKIVEIVRKNPGEVSILTLGPMTNVARSFLEDSTLESTIKQIVSMGGAVEVPGNKNRVAEFNMFVDPDAADIVMRASVKKTLIPLDACNQISLGLNDFNRLRTSLTYGALRPMMEEYIRGIQTFEKTKGALMYDPLAAYYLIRPEVFTLKEMDILVETKGELTRGMTVAERRTGEAKNPNTMVVTRIDRGAFINDFFDILSR